MGLYLNTDSQEQIELASNAGWSAMGRWIDTLDVETYPDLIRLWESGWSEPVSAVSEQLRKALAVKPPERFVRKTASELLESLDRLRPDSAVVVSDGLEADDGEAVAEDAPGTHPPHPGLIYNPDDHHYHKPNENKTVAKSTPDQHMQSLLSQASKVPAQLADKVSTWITGKYEKLAMRYGSNGARAIIGAAILLSPLPIPGSSLIPIALAEGVRRLYDALKKKGEKVSEEGPLTDEQIQAEARKLLDELNADFGKVQEDAPQPSSVINNPPDLPQHTSFTCGSAVTREAMKFFGHSVGSEEEVAKELGTTRKESTHPDRIEAYLTSKGLIAIPRQNMTVDYLRQCATEKKLVLCPIREYLHDPKVKANEEYGHWVIFVGYVDHGNMLVVEDPSIDNALAGSGAIAARGKMLIERDKWMEVWHDTLGGKEFRHFGIVVSEPDGLPIAEEWIEETHQDQPPFPGAVFNETSHRWEKPTNAVGGPVSGKRERSPAPVSQTMWEAYQSATGKAKELLANALHNGGVHDPEQLKKLPKGEFDDQRLASTLAGQLEYALNKGDEGTQKQMLAALASIGGRLEGKAGEVAPFDGGYFDAPEGGGIFTNDRVKIVQPAIVRDAPNGNEVILRKGKVERLK